MQLVIPSTFLSGVRGSLGGVHVSHRMPSVLRGPAYPTKALMPRARYPPMPIHSVGAPPADKCPCVSFKAVDKTYQGFNADIRMLIRQSNRKRKLNAYMAYMKWGIRHALRGFPVTPHPSFVLEHGWNQTYNYTPIELEEWEPGTILHPMRSCHNYGLSYARAWMAELDLTHYPHARRDFAVKFYYFCRDWHRPVPHGHFYKIGCWDAYHDPPDFDRMDWWFSEECLVHEFRENEGNVALRFIFGLPERDRNGDIIHQFYPDADRVLDLMFLHTSDVYTHWPRKPDSVPDAWPYLEPNPWTWKATLYRQPRFWH